MTDEPQETGIGHKPDPSKVSAQGKAWAQMDDEAEAAISRAIKRLRDEREAKERDTAAAGSTAPSLFEGGESPGESQPTP